MQPLDKDVLGPFKSKWHLTSRKYTQESEEQKKAKSALEIFQSTLSTLVRQRYADQLVEGIDLEGQSPCFDVNKKLHDKSYPFDRGFKNGADIKVAHIMT